MQLTPHFHLDQLIASETAQARGIDNHPDAIALRNLQRLAEGLEQVQTLLGHPLQISSAYRSPALNAAVGGALRSQHCKGLAADFTCAAFGPPLAVAHAISTNSNASAANIRFDQCILEYGRWVHLSFASPDTEPRQRVLSIHDSRQGYLLGLVDAQGKILA
jgi:hypothetical protein